MLARCLSLTLSLHARTVCSSSQGFACKGVSTVMPVYHGAVPQVPALATSALQAGQQPHKLHTAYYNCTL